MRRKQEEISDRKEIEKLLSECRIGRLATLGLDGFPYITPLNYVYWKGAVYFHCARSGEKLDNINNDSRVCFEVDIPLAYLDAGFDSGACPCAVTQFYKSVIIRGRAERVEEMEEKVGALNALMASHEEVDAFQAITEDTAAVKLCTVIAVRIDSLSAKANVARKKTEREKEKICSYLEKRNLPGDGTTVREIRW
jgi:nitroimidazol reductase NimA-like FMN-containing flavoprotein (pyridoxamine 5'-phosphate oxidase superfamily)